MPVVPLRWVLIRDPLGHFKTQALSCTDVQAAPAFMLDCFVRRWQMEVAFEEARAHLGVQIQRQWSDKAIARTMPCLLGLYSLVTLAAHHAFSTKQERAHNTAWYAKLQLRFSDAIASVRRWLWRNEYFSTSSQQNDMIKIPRPLFHRLMDSLCYAA